MDPIQSAAFAIQTHPGVYAVLVGSGVSRAADIPTGWEIVLDLIGKVAVSEKESANPDPEHWYLKRYGEAPDYSRLLDTLAKTPTERQQLLQPYFEPTDQEREDGLKQPTAAHRAIARLVQLGFVRVIITTNFDRLVERALDDEGIAPEVISSRDQVSGALPLTHARCRVIKLNGDYLDSRIRNTPEELDKYPDEFNELLDRIFDEFGLVVCGWSADWDGGLRDALYRTPTRRFTTFWATKGEPADNAQRLIDHRQAEVIPIDDADTFFGTVLETVESIQEFSKPHPLSTEASVTSLKRYLTNPEHRIRVADLINATVEQVINATSGEGFEIQEAPTPTQELVSSRMRRYESACSTLLAMAPVGGLWAEDHHYYGWGEALGRLAAVPSGRIYVVWATLATYPGRLLLYAIGMGAVESGRLKFLNRIFKTPVFDPVARNNAIPILTKLFDGETISRLTWDHFLEGMTGRYVPLSDWVHDALRQPLKSLLPNDGKYDLTFDKLEILISLGFAALFKSDGRPYWAPVGAFIYRTQNRENIIAEFLESISKDQFESPFVKCEIFGDTPETCLNAITEFQEFTAKGARNTGIYY